MGALRFHVLCRDRLPKASLERILVTGLDGIAWVSRARWDGQTIVISRAENDSGNIHVPFLVETSSEEQSASEQDSGASSLQEHMLSTASLMERDRPYALEVELARGALNQVRNQIGAWEPVGMVISKEVRALLAEATATFAAAATSQHDQKASASHALLALKQIAQLATLLGESYTDQAISVRKRQTAPLNTLLGVNLGGVIPHGKPEKTLLSAVNIAVVPVPWRQIQPSETQRDWKLVDAQLAWRQQHKIRTCSGPLLKFDSTEAPDWLYLWEGDYENVAEFMLEQVTAVVERYQGRFQIWQVASRINLGGSLGLTEQQSLSIVARAVELIRRLDPNTPIIVSFDQPWAEYMARRDTDLSPLHLADTLVRAELGLAGIGLEINAGYYPAGAAWYNLLDYSQLLDRWSMLGLPLVLLIRAPGGGLESPDDTSPSDAEDPTVIEPTVTDSLTHVPLVNGSPSQDLQRQAEWIERYLPMMLSKNCVQMVLWNQFADDETSEFPQSGLVDSTGQAKPSLDALLKVRQTHLDAK